MTSHPAFSVEFLLNGLISIRSIRSGLRGTYESNGQYRHGDLRLSQSDVLRLIG